MNKQNYRIWGTEKPEIMKTRPLHPQKLTVWYGICSEGVIGPFFIESNINAEVYNDLLRDQISPELESKGLIKDFYYQQDGAPPHCTRDNLTLLREHFGLRVISRKFFEFFDEGYDWPPYSPDLSVCDFFLWGCVKDKTYTIELSDLRELRERVTKIISELEVSVLRQAISSFEKRLPLTEPH